MSCQGPGGVSVRGSDELGPQASVQRVAWCSEARDGRFWLGLERLEELEGR